ncbi:MAG: hypothetical protein WBV71_01075, partial [Roseobacter sp.]
VQNSPVYFCSAHKAALHKAIKLFPNNTHSVSNLELDTFLPQSILAHRGRLARFIIGFELGSLLNWQVFSKP